VFWAQHVGHMARLREKGRGMNEGPQTFHSFSTYHMPKPFWGCVVDCHVGVRKQNKAAQGQRNGVQGGPL
jgi:hypothetical protein